MTCKRRDRAKASHMAVVNRAGTLLPVARRRKGVSGKGVKETAEKATPLWIGTVNQYLATTDSGAPNLYIRAARTVLSETLALRLTNPGPTGTAVLAKL